MYHWLSPPTQQKVNVDPIRHIEPIRPREAPSNEVARHLLDYLLSGEIKPGGRLPSERELTRQLGVGRSAVRDAIRPLLLLGLVEARQGDGTYLRKPDSSLLPQSIEWGLLLGEHSTIALVEARTFVEVALASLAADRRTDDDITRIRSHADEMRQADSDLVVFSEADLAFHLAIAEAARNGVLSGILSSLQSLLRAWMLRVLAEEHDTEASYREHLPILDAISAGDVTASAAAMDAHMKSARQRLERAVLPSDGADESTVASPRGRSAPPT